jgi:methyl-accepting chemotaxis protein
MDAFRNSLGKLADRLDNATIALTEGATESGKAIDDASKALTINVNQAAESLVNGAALLDVALLGAKTAINELNQTIDRVTEMGRVGGRQFDLSLAETDAVVEKLRETGEGWTQAVQALNKTSGQLVEVVNSIEELAHEQTAVVNSVREVAPNAMAAVANVSKVLETSALQAEKAMHEARDAMQSTGKTLGGTVTAITEGVAEYSKQVAALHLGMDSQMAKAVGQMGGAIAALQEAVEELSETLEAKMPKT